MIQTPIELDQDPEPDIRRFSPSTYHQPHQESPNTTLSPDHQHILHHGVSDSRIDRSFHSPSVTRSDYNEKSDTAHDIHSATDVTCTTADGDKRDKLEIDVPVSRSSSKRPKVRDFAVTNITDPIRRATEKLVPARRDGSPEVAFALPPDRPGTPRPRMSRAQPKLLSATPGWKLSFKNMMKHCPILWAAPILIPISWALHFTHQSATVVFVASLLAVVPLAGGLSFATEELANRVGDALGGLLNATFGNAIELLIAILALVKGDIDIVQASMIGSILSNVLLVLGMSYFAGGLRFHEQQYGIIGAQMHISLLGITLAAIALPAAYHYAYPNTSDTVDAVRSPGRQLPLGQELDNLLMMSRGLAFILLAVYGMFLTFQLYTHAYLFQLPRSAPIIHPLPGPKPHHDSVFPRPNWVPSITDSTSTSSSSSRSSTGTAPSRFRRLRRWSKSTRPRSESYPSPTEESGPPILDNSLGAADEEANIRGVELPHPHAPPPDCESINGDRTIMHPDDQDDEHWAPEVKVNFFFAFLLLSTMTALGGVTAEWLVESIDGLTEAGGVSREFVGLILLPVVGNSCEHITAVTVSVKDKLNLSMSIAVGSSIQVSLCILPILVLVGWAIGQPMMLFFDTFETVTLVVSLLLVNFAISDGRTNYLEGFVMMMAYVMIALVCWFYDPVN